MATEFTDQTFLAGVEKQPGATMSAPESGEKSLDSEPGRARGSRPARDRGRQGGGRGGHEGRKKRKEAGRTEWSRNVVDKRARNDQIREAAKRRKMETGIDGLPIYATRFSKEEIEAQEKKPKRKVAVMIGYSGSGNHREKTIEGDLFSAFVTAGAISKANADDPKKSSLIRCARTDKGVHAAGNVISLKLIVEDTDIVAKINENLSPQIRVWGIERTNGGFSAYQFCDSRIYEYLIPTHCFLPPHPQSFLAKILDELAKEANDFSHHQKRQAEVANFWSEAENQYVRPVIEQLDPSIKDVVLKAFYENDYSSGASVSELVGDNKEECPSKEQDSIQQQVTTKKPIITPLEGADTQHPSADAPKVSQREDEHTQITSGFNEKAKEPSPLELAVRKLKTAHIQARKAYRIHPDRLARVRSTLSLFNGTHKFHNYTIDKTIRDASASRIINKFVVGENPIVINDTEWLSLKVHGQSFMMHQIRKMVSMVALIVRCGCNEDRLRDSYQASRFSIPKAPSLGLLLERPVFDVYNEKLEGFGRERIDFGRYEAQMEAFKQREIYERIFREEERDNTFHNFFTSLDNARSAQLLYLSSVGLEATKREIKRAGPSEAMVKSDIGDVLSDDDGEEGGEG